MKKVSILVFAIFALCTVIFVACKRNADVVAPESKTVGKQKQKGTLHISSRTARVANAFDIDPDGYLVIPDFDDVQIIMDYLTSHTHGEVKSHFSDENFSSLGASIYSPDRNQDTVSITEAQDYMLSVDGLVQVGKYIVRPISPNTSCSNKKWDFALIMDTANRNSASISSMKDGTYDGSYMNQLATLPSEQAINLDSLMTATPTGIHETDASTYCPTETGKAGPRPLIGLGPLVTVSCGLAPEREWIDQNGDGDPDPTYSLCTHRRKYFIIGIGWTPTSCQPAYGCD